MSRRRGFRFPAVLLALALGCFFSGSTASPIASENLCWVRTGGPQGGLGYDIRVNPEDPSLWYVTDSKSGLHMSTDGGRTWFVSNRGIDVRQGLTGDLIPVFSLTIDPHDPSIIWAGTQGVLGVYRSEDGGRTWERKVDGIKESEGISFRGFSVDPRSSDVVYAAAEITSWAWTPDHGPRRGKSFDLVMGVVYRTTNSGETWEEIWRGDNLARYVLINPEDPDIIYISTGIFDREAANSNLRGGLTGGVGVVKSIDGGATWTALNQGNGLNNLYVGSLAMHPVNPDILLAGTGVNGGGTDQPPGVYRSDDGGSTWQQVLECPSVTSVEFADADPRIAYAGAEHAFFWSEDGGLTWDSLSPWGPRGFLVGQPIDFQTHPSDPLMLFANNYAGGNFMSEDGGATWTDASSGYSGNDVWEIAVHPDDPETIFVAGLSGVFSSSDGGATWEGLNHAGMARTYSVAVDPRDGGVVLCGDAEAGIYHLARGETRWAKTFDDNHWAEELGMGIRAVTHAPSDPSIVYASVLTEGEQVNNLRDCEGMGLLRSTDGGRTWARAGGQMAEELGLFAVAVHPEDPDKLYSGGVCCGLYRSTDAGQSLERISSFPCTGVAVISIHPLEPDTIYVGTNGCGVQRSTDGGATWESLERGLPPEGLFRGFAIDPVDPDVLYVGDELSGVYRSTNAGESWQPINNGLLVRAVRCLAISSDGRVLYAGTNGGGVFRLDTTGVENGSDCSLGPSADRDGDGVPDEEDLCPDFPGSPEMGGC